MAKKPVSAKKKPESKVKKMKHMDVKEDKMLIKKMVKKDCVK